MRRKMGSLLLAAVLCMSMPMVAHADVLPTRTDWYVTFTQDKKMDSNFHGNILQADESVGQMQPGDEITFEITLKNENNATTNWYMTNEVLKTLEKTEPGEDEDGAYSETSGGAYTYILNYEGLNGSEKFVKELFKSESVGGDEGYQTGNENVSGLEEATNALEGYLFLDTLAKGETGKISLRVKLDGETEGNAYQDTLAKLQMNFAVELATTTPSRQTNRSATVRTGDESMPVVYIAIMAASGLVLLILAILGWRRNRKEQTQAVGAPRRGGRVK